MTVLALVIAACGGGSSDPADPVTTTRPDAGTTSSLQESTTTTGLPTSTTTIPSTTVPPLDGRTLAVVVADVNTEWQGLWDTLYTKPPGEAGPYVLECPDAALTPAGRGDVFACVARPQPLAGADLEPLATVVMVINDEGHFRWLRGTDLPDSAEQLGGVYAAAGTGRFCRELTGAGPPFDLGYDGAVAYWFMEGLPSRMDADGDGIPCETVFPISQVWFFWEYSGAESNVGVEGGTVRFAKIVAADPGRMTLTVDYMQFLRGGEANQAAINAGDLEPGDTVPNDYYIVNDDPEAFTFPIDAAATVSLQTFSSTGGIEARAVELADFLRLLGETEGCGVDEPPPRCYEAQFGGDDWTWLTPGALPYWVTIADGRVVGVEEQYLP